MWTLSVLLFLICNKILLRLFRFLRLLALGYWSYMMGAYVFPKDIAGNEHLAFSTCLFAFIVLGTLMPPYMFPRLRFLATVLSIPPQIHLLILINRNLSPVENEIVQNALQCFTCITLASTVWSVLVAIPK